jgi:phage portal protein BeeE
MGQFGDQLAQPGDQGVQFIDRGVSGRPEGDHLSTWQRWRAQLRQYMPTPLVQLMQQRWPFGIQRGTAIFTLGGHATIGMSYDFMRIYASVYGNPTGYRCMEAIKANFCRPTWMILPFDQPWPENGTELTAKQTHPLLDLLNQPNDSMSGTLMLRTIAQDQEMSGKSFWFKVRGQTTGLGGTADLGAHILAQRVGLTGKLGPITELRRFPPQRMYVYGNADDELLGFVYTDRFGRMFPALPDDVLYLRYPDPERLFDGRAPAMAAGLPAETDTAGARFNREILDSDGALPGYVVLEGLTREQFAEWKQEWESGKPGKVRFIRGTNAKYFKAAQTNQELTYSELRHDSQDDVLRAFGVPRAVAFDVSHETYANAEREQAIFMQHNILPKWILNCDEMTLQLRDDFDGVKVALNLTGIDELQDSRDAMVERGTKLMGMKAQTINEFRRTMGWPPVSWGDEPASPVQPMSAIPLQPEDTPLPEEPPVPSTKARRALIEARLRENPARSNREIARLVGCDDKTAAVVRRDLEERAEIPHFEPAWGRGVTTRNGSH